uniref:Immunoglobulin V-set domain-containing protein n=1 Tax=Stegastes partitus TaxID=144197 RepID=A0A3B5AI79_9TELE
RRLPSILLLLLLAGAVSITIHLSTTASQNPASTSYKRVNSSAEITCSTSLSDPMGVYLHRRFHSNKDIVYLSLKGGLITKNTINEDFAGRIVVTPDQQIKGGYGFTMQLSLLELEDTNLYYCSWTYFELSKKQTVSSNGTVIIVSGETNHSSHSPITSKRCTYMSLFPRGLPSFLTETGPKEQCREPIWDFTLILLSITAFIVVLSLFIAALIWRCRRVSADGPALVVLRKLRIYVNVLINVFNVFTV